MRALIGVVALTLLLSTIKARQRLHVSGTHLMAGDRRIFLSGANAAWVTYSYDFGNHQYQRRRQDYITIMDRISKAGGNSMRTFVHLNGASSPHFDSNGFATGLDADGSFISDFKQFLDDAYARNILIFPCLWNAATATEFEERLRGLITDTDKLQSYIDNALIPWVKAVKDHPALEGWDVLNEMEGRITVGQKDPEPCFDTQYLSFPTSGWASQDCTARDLLRFINWLTEAVHRTDPHALVTAGSAHQHAQTGNYGQKNLYSDHCLVKAGGKQLGTLDFYSTHTYDWRGEYVPLAPFKHDFSDYQLSKPLVIAEFSQAAGGGMTSSQQFTYAYHHGYSGAWSWQMREPAGHNGDSPDAQQRGMEAIRDRDDQSKGGTVHLNLHGVLIG